MLFLSKKAIMLEKPLSEMMYTYFPYTGKNCHQKKLNKLILDQKYHPKLKTLKNGSGFRFE